MMFAKSDWKSIRFLLSRFLRPYYRLIAGLVALNVFVGMLISVRPLIMAPALDVFMGGKAAPAKKITEITLSNLGATLLHVLGFNRHDFVQAGLVVAGIYLLVSILIAAIGFAGYVASQRMRASIARDMMTGVHQHLLTLPLAFFHKNRAGDLVSRVSQDANMAASFMDATVRGFMQAVARTVITLVILLYSDPLFTLSIVVIGGIHISITRFLGDRVRNTAKGVFQKLGVLNARLFESFSSIRLVKSFAAETHDAAQVEGVAETLRRHQIRFMVARHADDPLRVVADALVVALILLLAFYAVAHGRLTPEAAIMFFYLVQQVAGPVSEIAKQLLGMQQVLGGASRMLEIFATDSDLVDGDKNAEPIREKIEFRNVEFSYEPGRPVLQEINLEIGYGEMVALVGPSGSGKSTLADLLLRFYDVSEGQILYDGHDIREFQQESYRKNFGVVSQECLLFNSSVRENIVYNRKENANAIAHATWVANADEFIDRLPKGLNTFIGDRGVRLSGGQRQRVAIARAVYGRPEILLLDEATSALDTESERAVQEAIDRISKEMTTVVIAHRLSTILHADRIIVLSNGRIEAIGPHQQILRTSPTYKKLYEMQFSSLEEKQSAIS